MKIRIAAGWIGVVMLISLSCLQGCAPDDTPLRVALLPILDSLPFFVAEAEGFFQEEGLAVELIAAGSAAERDQLFQANQVDVLITDLVALTLVNRDGIELIGVRNAMVPTEQFAQFRVLAAPGLDLDSIAPDADDAVVPLSIGVSEGTVIHYITDRLLAAAGFSPDQFETIAVPRIADRMALLIAGELPAATLPEPLATLAVHQGAQAIVDDTQVPAYSSSIIAVRAELLETQPETIQGLLHAIRQASTAINADKAAWVDLLAEKQLVPPTLAATYRLPDYPSDTVPSTEQVDDAAAWLRAQGLLTDSPPYPQSDIVTTAFLR
jgi:NitT/TauT family transport system substrate-binding protein